MNRETTEELPPLTGPLEWRLEIRGPGRERVRTLRRGESLTLGSSDEVDVTLCDARVSGRHCRLNATGRGLLVSDLGSRNGVFVGEGRVAEALAAGPHAVISIGATTIVATDKAHLQQTAELGLIGESAEVQRLRERIVRVARLGAPVLLLGESGTGKDLVARALHVESGRAGAYVPLNVAAVPETLLDSELFGHVRGAFTGAEAARLGAFRAADGGTLFLDEIAELSAAGQAKLLRVVEDGMVRPVGSTSAERSSARVVAATCAPLAEYIEAGRFRHDLYHRLSVLTIRVPSLRERASDIPLLATAFLERHRADFGHKRLSALALERLGSAHFPGNVRQLFSVLYKAAALTPGDVIGPGEIDIEPRVRRPEPVRLGVERALELLDAHGSVSRAARAAGVPRTTFRSVIERKSGQKRASSEGGMEPKP